jgi:hypothetical protein
MRLLLITAMTLWAANLATAEQREALIITGVGSTTCAVFAQNYKRNPKLSDLAYGTWAEGMITGMNVAKPDGTKTRNAAAHSSAELAAWNRHYCDEHPLALFAQAIIAYYSQLPEIPQSK